MPNSGKLILGDVILGVDGGGTKTTACLAEIGPDHSVTILAHGHAGSSNIKAVGADTALTNLRAAIDAAWQQAQREPHAVARAVFGLSGAGRPETQALVSEWSLTQAVARQSRVVHDALPVLMAGTPAGAGVALIAGTGAVAYAVNAAGQTHVVGGWGFWFGDEGSAFWLGQAAARAAAHAVDGRGPKTQLTDLILKHLQITEPREMLTALGREGDVRSGLAALAPLVTKAAEQEDHAALEIIAATTDELSALVAAAAMQAGFDHDFPLALAGGVVTGSSLIRTSLLAKLAAARPTPTSVEVVSEPVLGCVKLAADDFADAQ